MSQSVNFNDQSYLIPDTGDVNWGDSVTSYLVAIASGTLQLSGGAFFLTDEVDFGPNFGLKSTYYKSRTSNPADAGQVRLARTDSVAWRNVANNANLLLTVDGSNNLTFNGGTIVAGGITALTGDVTATGPGSVPATLATVNSNVGSFNWANITVNGKGLVTAASANSTPVTSITGTANQVIASASTGAVTLSTPQDIATTSSPTFANLTLPPTGVLNMGLNGAIFSADGYTIQSNSVLGLVGTPIVTQGTIRSTSNKTDNLGDSTHAYNNINYVTSILYGSTSGTISISAADTTTSYGVKMPAAQGGASTFLQNDGSGNLSWVTPTGGGTVNAGTAGRLAVYPASSDAVSDTYVQNANDIHIAIASHAALASTRTYSIPDAGGDASFVMNEGNQTIAGTKIFSGQDQHSVGLAITGSSANVSIAAADSNSSGVSANFLNTDTGAGSYSRILLQGTATGGDAYSLYESAGTTSWSAGLDNSASDAFVISNNAAPGTDNAISISTSEVVTLPVQGIIHGTSTNDSAAAGYVGEYVEAIATATAAPTSTNYGDLTSISLTAGDWDIVAMVYWQQNGATWTQARSGISTTSGNSSAGLTLGTNEAIHQNASSATTPTGYTLSVPTYRASLSGTTTYYLKYAATYSAGGPPECRGRITARRVR